MSKSCQSLIFYEIRSITDDIYQLCGRCFCNNPKNKGEIGEKSPTLIPKFATKTTSSAIFYEFVHSVDNKSHTGEIDQRGWISLSANKSRFL
jgi:hypothetical protein